MRCFDISSMVISIRTLGAITRFFNVKCVPFIDEFLYSTLNKFNTPSLCYLNKILFICQTNKINTINMTDAFKRNPMNTLKIHTTTVTLVDHVEDKLLNYFKENDLRAGDSIPNEVELAQALGVARSVLREALSRLKMMGMIETRTGRGMSLAEPSILGGMKRVVDPRILGENTLFDILGFRIGLEIGICSDIFRYITPKDIRELEEIVRMEIVFENNEYAPISEFSFHTKLYEITGNKIISEFQEIVHPVMVFVKDKFKDLLEPINIEMKKENKIVTHADLLGFIQKGDEIGYRKAIEQHFAVYKIFMQNRT